MHYNREDGRRLMEKYLANHPERKRHTESVAEFLYAASGRISERHPELNLHPEFVGFLGYVHDIGYSQGAHDHERWTIELLREEGVPFAIAMLTQHGPLQPRGLEGILLSAADMSIRFGSPVTLDERFAEQCERIARLDLPQERKDEIVESIRSNLPRFGRYVDLLCYLAGVEKITDL